MNEVAIAARVIVGVTLLVAAIAKVRTPHWGILALEAGTPRPVVLALPAVEGVLGLALVLQVIPLISSWLAVVLMGAFTATVVHRYATGSKAPCNCFGGASNDPVGRSTIIRNVALLALAVVGAIA